MITRRTFLQSSAAAAAFAASASSARADNAPGVTDTEIKIGQTMPYSGPASAYGVIGRTVPGDILCFSPPLIISEAEVDEMLDRIGKALDELTVQLRREQISVVH